MCLWTECCVKYEIPEQHEQIWKLQELRPARVKLCVSGTDNTARWEPQTNFSSHCHNLVHPTVSAPTATSSSTRKVDAVQSSCESAVCVLCHVSERSEYCCNFMLHVMYYRGHGGIGSCGVQPRNSSATYSVKTLQVLRTNATYKAKLNGGTTSVTIIIASSSSPQCNTMQSSCEVIIRHIIFVSHADKYNVVMYIFCVSAIFYCPRLLHSDY